MTRINLVDPAYLTDKHLMAEYRELPRIFTAVLKAQHAGKKPSDFKISPHYLLGTGHVIFFYNKILWLKIRFCALRAELLRRKFKLDTALYYSITSSIDNINNEWYTDWTPTPEEIYLNMARIVKRTKVPAVVLELRAD